jgi:dTDP-glucose pyrophosphorylase
MSPNPGINLDDLMVAPDASILSVMKTIDRTGLEVALVCDANRTLLSVVTDGDIRRRLIKGGSLADPIVDVGCRTYTATDKETDRVEALRLMVAGGFKCLPVIDAERRLLDLHTLSQALLGNRTGSWAVIMAGGKGERLGDLTHAMPKPMLPLGDRPIIEHIINLLVSHGFHRIFISVNYLGKMIKDHFGDGSRFHCRIDYIEETHPLGTGGALTLLPQIPEEPLLVMNGDLVTNINLSRMMCFHREHGFAATMALREHTVKVPFGVVDFSHGRVERLREKPSLQYHINAGIYILDPSVISLITPGCMYPITELVDACIAGGRPVGAYPIHEKWSDVGLPEEYRNANQQ